MEIFDRIDELFEEYEAECSEREEFRNAMRMRAEQRRQKEEMEKAFNKQLERAGKIADIELKKKGIEAIGSVTDYLNKKARIDEAMFQQKMIENIARQHVIEGETVEIGPNMFHRLAHPISEIINRKRYVAAPKRFSEIKEYVPWMLPYIDKIRQYHKSVENTDITGRFIWTDVVVNFKGGGQYVAGGFSRKDALALKRVLDRSGPDYFIG